MHARSRNRGAANCSRVVGSISLRVALVPKRQAVSHSTIIPRKPVLLARRAMRSL